MTKEVEKVPTRSTYSLHKYKGLTDYFKPTDQDTEKFVRSLDDIIQNEGGGDHDEELMRKLVSGKVDKVKTPKKLREHLSGFVRIWSGWHSGDYVWHIEHAAIKRPWKVHNNRVIYMICVIMNDHLPDIDAKIWPPQADWELRTITFKALNMIEQWNFDESVVDRINAKLFEVLNTIV